MSWIRLSTCIDYNMSVPVKLNMTEFVVAVKSGVYIYNTSYDTWHLLVGVGSNIQGRLVHASIAIDQKRQILYIKPMESMLIVIDMKEQTFQPLFYKTDNARGRGRLMVLNGQLNLIGGSSQSRHFVWHDYYKCFGVRNSLVGLRTVRGMTTMCQVRKRGELRNDTLFIFEKDFIRHFDEFGVWKALHGVLPPKFETCGCAVTTDQKYVILIGRAPPKRVALIAGEHLQILTCDSNQIFVFDTEEQRLYKSRVQCPQNSKTSVAIVMAHKIEPIVAGYVRQNGNAPGVGIPFDISKMVCEFSIIEYLHWITKNRGHWKIGVDVVVDGMISILTE